MSRHPRLFKLCFSLFVAICVTTLPERALSPLSPASAPILSAPVPTAEASAVHVGAPKRLVIPTLNIDTEIVKLGLLANGDLDAPKIGEVAGWFELGPKPGEDGTAIIDGHKDTAEGPGVFYHLSKLKAGDSFSITDDQNATRKFTIRERQIYNIEDAPLDKIFGYKPGKNLNLITCAGAWQKKFGHYDKRLVLFTEEI